MSAESRAHRADAERQIALHQPIAPTTVRGLLDRIQYLERVNAQYAVQAEATNLAAIHTAHHPTRPELLAGIKRIAAHALDRRAFWANHPDHCAVPRAVAYQHLAGELIKLIDQESE